MRVLLYAAAALALAAVVPLPLVASMLATCASVVLEALPFLAFGGIVRALGCGCGRAGARALPVVALAWLLFGPAVAVARFIAALIAARLFSHEHERTRRTALDDLAALLPSAVLAAVVLQFTRAHALPPVPLLEIALGALLGFAGAPCALGGVALAAAARAHAPLATAAILCISGLVDVRTVFRPHIRKTHENAAAYALLAIVCALAALKKGFGLVHPLFTVPLAVAGAAFAWRAMRARWQRLGFETLAPAILCAGMIIGAPMPRYYANETTLAGAFAGEHVRFTGELEKSGNGAELVRYAITCCRADAQPVVLRLASAPAFPERTWLSVEGTLARTHESLALVPTSIAAIAPPADPFVYR